MNQLSLFRHQKGACLFYLGTHRPNWLGEWAVPLFVSRRQLAGRKTLPRARAPWALDSGGFTELNMHGRWETPAAQYAGEVQRFADEVGSLSWAAIQDWMCEPFVLGKTGLSVQEHQARTIASYLELKAMAPGLPWTPVVQGWAQADYHRHVDAYGAAGVDLATLPIVGVGSVCRRQHSAEALGIFASLARRGLKLHGFGLKLKGLEMAAEYLTSADSLAWSFSARKNPPLPGCRGHKNCANCRVYASRWREKVIALPGVLAEAA